MKMLCVFICCVFGAISCKNTSRLEDKDLYAELIIDNVSDSMYFSDICSLSSIGNKLFFVDQKSSKIFVLSDDFKSCKFWGETGHAGNEFIFLAGIHPVNDTVYSFDAGRQIIFIYDTNGNLLNQYLFKGDELFFSREYRCIIDNKKLIGCAYTVENGCMSIDMRNHNIVKWGKIFNFKSEKQKMLRNGRHLFRLNDIYITVSDNLPVIELYNQKYNRLLEYNYSNVDFVHLRLKNIERNKGEENSYSILCYDAYLYNKSLYLLMTGFDHGEYVVNKIIKVNIDGNNVSLEKVLNLPGRIYSSICINGKGLFAFNKSDSRLEFLRL